jgi:hypothetical protein
MGLISKRRMNHLFRKEKQFFPATNTVEQVLSRYQGGSQTVSKIDKGSDFFWNFF